MPKKTGPAYSEDLAVFHSPTCPHCVALISYLEVNGIRYQSRNVVESERALNELVSLTGRKTIPVMTRGQDVISGFDREAVRGFLNIDPSRERVETKLKAARIPQVEDSKLEKTVEQAKQVLAENQYGKSTKASRHLYPHQWNWDAGFIARGYLRYEPQKAYQEIRSLFQGQWSDGYLPHIIFNPDYLNHFPGPDYWHANRSGRVPQGVHTSGITQPPVHASVVASALELDAEKGRARRFLRELYPKLRKLHECYYTHRDPHGENLVCIVHPWESGLDNSPLWDTPLSHVRGSSVWAKKMAEISDRGRAESGKPPCGYCEKYAYLVEGLYRADYDWMEILRNHPFQIQDVLFNTILCQSERDLGLIAETIGLDPQPHREKADELAAAVNRKLWNDEEGLYFNYDLVQKVATPKDTVFCYLPLFAGICSESQARRLIDNLKTHCYCVADRNCLGIPSYDMCQVDFDGEHYWRGPIWINICWYLIQGLRRYGVMELADWLEKSLLALIMENGFYEYFEPETGKGLGAEGFSWTASLFIDMAWSYL
jgi:glutaredoxin